MNITVKGKTYRIKKYTPKMVIEADRLLKDGMGVSVGDEAEFIQGAAEFLADTVFSGEFSADDFMEGYESETIMVDILGMLGAVRGVVSAEIAKFSQSEGREKNAKGVSPKPSGK